ncbi:MAG: pyrroline-5-carboxylate reductase [Opitutaceae bacterium]|nr:pyrroline-5-carboxylate reductase [Opitutaceae bacterium]
MAKIVFLGAGNMAGAMVHGLLAKQVVPPLDLACYTASGRSAAALASATGIRQASTPEDLLSGADLLVVAFKPQHLSSLTPEWKELTAGKLVLSIMSGKTLARLHSVFPLARNWVRTMPNTPGRIGAGITGWCAAHELTGTDRHTVQELLGALGRELETTEADLDAITAVSGSGPGFVFEFAAAMESAARDAGLGAAQARLLTVETLLGSARLLARTGENPEQLRDQVTSPNGTTLAGLNTLKAGHFRALLSQTVLAARARAREIAQEP